MTSVSAIERTPLRGDRFILLADFWEGFRVLEARHYSAEAFIRARIQDAMYDALREAIPRVTVLSIEAIRDQANNAIQPSEFVVTLDGGILFPAADFRIEITRAADSIRNSIAGPYLRVARGMAPQLRQQATNLRGAYSGFRDTKSIVLCDDGIGTGQTIRSINSLLRQLSLGVGRIITITNPLHLTEIDGIPITTIYPTDEQIIWLNERDLYWGLPRSGLSVHKVNQFVAIGGVPYTLSDAMVRSRIGLHESSAGSFRRVNLTLNRRLWQELEALHGRPLTLKDCSRLQFFGDFLENPDLPIVQLIEQAESGELLRRLGLGE